MESTSPAAQSSAVCHHIALLQHVGQHVLMYGKATASDDSTVSVLPFKTMHVTVKRNAQHRSRPVAWCASDNGPPQDLELA